MRARVAAAVLAAAALVVGPLAAAHALVVPGPAVAVTGDDDGEAVVAVSETEGTWSGTLEVTNASGGVVELAVAAKSGLGDDCAPPEVSPDQVEANRVQSVTIEVSCEVPDGGAVVVLTLGPDEIRTVDVTLDPETSVEPEWAWFLVVRDRSRAGPRARAGGRGVVGSPPGAGDRRRRPAAMEGGDRPREPETEDVDLSTPVTGAPSGWSFSESWASNFTAVLALLTALFGSADMLDAFLGEAPDGAEGQLLVAAAGAALLVGIAPLALKLVGPTSTPTVGGIALGRGSPSPARSCRCWLWCTCWRTAPRTPGHRPRLRGRAVPPRVRHPHAAPVLHRGVPDSRPRGADRGERAADAHHRGPRGRRC